MAPNPTTGSTPSWPPLLACQLPSSPGLHGPNQTRPSGGTSADVHALSSPVGHHDEFRSLAASQLHRRLHSLIQFGRPMGMYPRQEPPQFITVLNRGRRHLRTELLDLIVERNQP